MQLRYLVVSGMSALLIKWSLLAFITIALIWGFKSGSSVVELSDRSMVGFALAFKMGVGFAITIFVIWLLPVLAEHLVGDTCGPFLVPYQCCCYDAKSLLLADSQR